MWEQGDVGDRRYLTGGLWRICGSLDVVRLPMQHRTCISSPKGPREAKAWGFQTGHLVPLTCFMFCLPLYEAEPGFLAHQLFPLSLGRRCNGVASDRGSAVERKLMDGAVKVFVSNMSR